MEIIINQIKEFKYHSVELRNLTKLLGCRYPCDKPIKLTSLIGKIPLCNVAYFLINLDIHKGLDFAIFCGDKIQTIIGDVEKRVTSTFKSPCVPFADKLNRIKEYNNSNIDAHNLDEVVSAAVNVTVYVDGFNIPLNKELFSSLENKLREILQK